MTGVAHGDDLASVAELLHDAESVIFVHAGCQRMEKRTQERASHCRSVFRCAQTAIQAALLLIASSGLAVV
jgi:hypothetical protein